MNQNPGPEPSQRHLAGSLPNVFVALNESGAKQTLDEALAAPDALYVLSGDYGGTIFLTVPVRRARCDLQTLRVLVSDLDAVTWMSGDPNIAELIVDRGAVGSRAPGGCGGGFVVSGVWTHPTMLPAPIREQAEAVVLGEQQRIDARLLRDVRAQELERKRAFREPRMAGRARPWDFDISPPLVPFDED